MKAATPSLLDRMLACMLSISLALGPATVALAEVAPDAEDEAIVEVAPDEDAPEAEDVWLLAQSDDGQPDGGNGEGLDPDPDGGDPDNPDPDNPIDPDNPGTDDPVDPDDPSTVEQPVDLSAAQLTLDAGSFVYDGSAKEPSVTLTLPPVDDEGDSTVVPADAYVVSYENNVDAGTASVSVTAIEGDERYVGSQTASFTIEACPIDQASVSGIKAYYLYTGKAQTPAPTLTCFDVTLVPKVDYSVSYAKNKALGTATITLSGKGNYGGTMQVTFAIKGDLSKATVSGVAKKTFNGKAQTQNPTVKLYGRTLKKGTDYTLSYAKNTNAGTATATITGRGNYAKSLSKRFTIAKRDFSKAKVSSIGKQAYTGGKLTPVPTVKWGSTKLKKGTDFTVSYKSNMKVGTATVTITGKGNYTGAKKTTTFSIYKRDAKNFKVASIGTKSYTGSAIKPSPTVKWGSTTLKKGTDYTLSYANNRYGGTATITITGKGRFTGSKKVTFKISGPRYYGVGVYITNTGDKYHRSGCRYLRYSSHKCDKGVAIYEGYTACKVCRP